MMVTVRKCCLRKGAYDIIMWKADEIVGQNSIYALLSGSL